MKTTILTFLGIFALTSMASAFPKYEFGAYAGSKLNKRTTVAVSAGAGLSEKKVTITPNNFNKGPGYGLK